MTGIGSRTTVSFVSIVEIKHIVAIIIVTYATLGHIVSVTEQILGILDYADYYIVF